MHLWTHFNKNWRVAKSSFFCELPPSRGEDMKGNVREKNHFLAKRGPFWVPVTPTRLGCSSQKKLDYITLQFLLKCVHKCIFKDGKIEAKKSVSNFFHHWNFSPPPQGCQIHHHHYHHHQYFILAYDSQCLQNKDFRWHTCIWDLGQWLQIINKQGVMPQDPTSTKIVSKTDFSIFLLAGRAF